MIYTFLFCKPGIDYRFFAIEINLIGILIKYFLNPTICRQHPLLFQGMKLRFHPMEQKFRPMKLC